MKIQNLILLFLIKVIFLFIGKICNIDVNECDSNPCLNSATCIDNVASFTCVCPIGLTGKLCETNINDCEVSPNILF